MGFRGAFWGTKKAAPAAPLAPPPRVSVPIPRSHQSLPIQLGRAVASEQHERGLTLATFGDLVRLRFESVQRLTEGRPMALKTLERLCVVLGWTLSLHDARNRLIVRYPPSEDASTESPATAPR